MTCMQSLPPTVLHSAEICKILSRKSHIKNIRHPTYINNTRFFIYFFTFRLSFNTKVYSFGRKHWSQDKKKCAGYIKKYILHLAWPVRLLTSMSRWTVGLKHSSHIRSAAYSFVNPELFALAHTHTHSSSSFWFTAWRWSFTGRSVQYFGSSLITKTFRVLEGGRILRAMRPSVNYVPIELQYRPKKHYK